MAHMKKVFAILLAAMISLSIAACGKKDPAVFAPVSAAPQQVMRGETMVGVLYPGNYSMPNSYSASHHEEILFAARLRLRDYETQLLHKLKFEDLFYPSSRLRSWASVRAGER